MAIEWRLQELMRSCQIANAYQLAMALEQELGIQISRVSLDKLLKAQPIQLRLETAQILCTLFQCPLDSLLSITPDLKIQKPGGLLQPYRKKEKPSFFMVDPGKFF